METKDHIATDSDKYSYVSPKTEFTTNSELNNPSTTQLMHEEIQLNMQEENEKTGYCTNMIFHNENTRFYMIIGVIGFIILSILIVIFIIIPLIVQSYANSTEIQMNSIDLISVDDQTLNLNMSYQLSQNLPASAKSDQAQAIVKYNGAEFGTVQIPSLEFESGKAITNQTLSSKTIITDKNIFTELGIAIVKEGNVTIEMEASITTHAMGFLKYNVDFVRELQITSLEQFQNPPPVVNSIHLKSCTSSNYIMIINATLDNTSQIGLDGIGDLKLSVYYGDTVRDDKYVGSTVPLNPSLGFPRGQHNYEFEVTMPNSFTKIPLLMQMFQGLVSNSARFQLSGIPPGSQSSDATDIDLLKPMFKEVQIDVVYKGGMSEFTTAPDCNILSLLGI